MANPIPETMDKTQGTVAAQEAALAAVPIPEEPVPPLQTEQTEQVGQTGPQAAPRQQRPVPAPFVPTSYMQTVPANILFAQNRRTMTPLERRSNVSIAWKFLAQSGDPTLQAIAKSIVKGQKG